jgi:hypothetical protein
LPQTGYQKEKCYPGQKEGAGHLKYCWTGVPGYLRKSRLGHGHRRPDKHSRDKGVDNPHRREADSRLVRRLFVVHKLILYSDQRFIFEGKIVNLNFVLLIGLFVSTSFIMLLFGFKLS